MLLSISYALLFLSLFTLYLARRGHLIDSHPLCRKCRYDLSALPSDRSTCSECGADVSTPKSRIHGRRQPIRPLLYTGFFLLLPSLPAAIFLTCTDLAGWNFLHYAPTWYILTQAQYASEATKAHAFTELQARLSSSPAPIIDCALQRQTDLSTPWDPRWGNLVESAKSTGSLFAATWERYLGQIFVPIHITRPCVGLAEDIAVSLTCECRCGITTPGASRYIASSQLVLHSDDPRIVTSPVRGQWYEFGSALPRGGFYHSHFPGAITVRLGVGTRKLLIEEDWTVSDFGTPRTVGSGTVSTLLTLTILPDPSSVRVVAPSPGDSAKTMNLETDHVGIYSFADSTGTPSATFGVDLHAKNPPANLAFRVILFVNNTERDVGPMTFHAGRNEGFGRTIEVPTGSIPSGPATLILRPDPAAAAETPDIFEIYGGELRIPVTIK
jgi:hypothetical protein